MNLSPYLAQRDYQDLGLIILYDKRLRRFHVLEYTAASIWRLLRNNTEPLDIARRLAEEYECDDSEGEILSDVNEFLASLRRNALVGTASPTYEKTKHEHSGGPQEEERILDLMAEARIPYNVTWELTHACNLRCKHCYCPKESSNFWSLPMIRETLEVLRGMGTIDIQVTGGECLCHPFFEDFLGLSSEMGFIVGILTNATLLDERKAEIIAALPPYLPSAVKPGCGG